ncbi:MAG: hypothetical protein RMJ03_06280 [Nitrososphaerota archaeon]|nr:hypothetical protein [Nitrososphaerota archaeon]
MSLKFLQPKVNFLKRAEVAALWCEPIIKEFKILNVEVYGGEIYA